MHPQSNYEQARDEAASKEAKEREAVLIKSDVSRYNKKELTANYFGRLGGFIAGADWHREYSQNINADLLADCKAMREALKFYSLKSNYSLVDEGRNYDVDYKCYELNEKTYGDEDLGTKARQVLSQLKGKYDEQTRN